MQNLPVYDIFYSLQGEGHNCGMAACFIRLAGCNVGCGFCDEKTAWQVKESYFLNIKGIIEEIRRTNAENVVVTGGEPTLYNLNTLTSELHKIGIKTFLETSGTNNITGQWDWITVSPKKNLLPVSDALKKADELKVVISCEEDFLFAQEIKNLVLQQKTLEDKPSVFYLQSEFSQKDKILPCLIDFIKRNPEWRLSLQTHKMLNIK